MREIHRQIVGAIIVSGDGKIFLAQRHPKSGAAYEGFWQMPGGGVEEGEDGIEAVRREALEELSLDLSGYEAERIPGNRKGTTEKTLKTGERVIVNMDFTEYRIIVHDKPAKDIPVKLSAEHSEYRWFDPAELAGLKLNQSHVEAFTQLGYLK